MDEYHDVLSSSMMVPVPELIFGPVLEEIDDVAELKCVLRIIFLLVRHRPNDGFIDIEEVIRDIVLSKALEGNTANQQRTIVARAVELVASHGILLKKIIRTEGQKEVRLYLNSPENRKRTGSFEEGKGSNQALPVISATSNSSSKRNVFQLYEEQIGIITPMVAERLKELENEYSTVKIQEAFRTAVSNDKRRLAYVEAILRSERESGRRNGTRGRRPEKISIMEIFRRARE